MTLIQETPTLDGVVMTVHLEQWHCTVVEQLEVKSSILFRLGRPLAIGYYTRHPVIKMGDDKNRVRWE